MTSAGQAHDENTGRGAIDPRFWKFSFLLLLTGFAFLAPEGTREATQKALSDAFIAVTSFVALTLLIFYTLEHLFKVDTASLLKKHERWQVPLAALTGALPGCGGAIIVITQYVLGRISFGGMVAVLTSTMGDAAFLLIAQEPKTALLVMVISIIVGTLSGLVVDRIHGRDFMRAHEPSLSEFNAHCGPSVTYRRANSWLWYLLLLPGIALGFGNAFQIDTDLWFSAIGAFDTYSPTISIGVIGALYCLYLWASLPGKGFAIVNLMAQPQDITHVQIGDRVMFETSFVTTWVILAFAIFQIGSHWASFDLGAMFATAVPLLPLIGLLVGFIPGCGPQIIVTTLYLQGLIPFSAQIANAISNDGDALFPAIALAPRTAILATVYTAIPALLVGYGFYFAGL